LHNTVAEDMPLWAAGDTSRHLREEEDFTRVEAWLRLSIEIRAWVLSAGRLLRFTDSAV
jgi:hypothetical protein